jgi:hypothetical protein
LLNHVSGSFGGIVGVYQRYDFLPEMREAIDRWEAHVLQLFHAPGGGKKTQHPPAEKKAEIQKWPIQLGRCTL